MQNCQTMLRYLHNQRLNWHSLDWSSLYQCAKACYGLCEAPRLWEKARDKTLCAISLTLDGDVYSLRQSA